MYVCADVPDTLLLRLDSAPRLAPPGSFATCESAGALWGSPVCDPLVPHVGVPKGSKRPRVQGVQWHQFARQPTVSHRRGRLTVDATTAFVQIAAHLGLLDAVIAGDAMVRQGHTSPGALLSAAAPLPGRTGGGIRRAAGLVRTRVDSPMETWLRLLIVLCGLPEPEVNRDVVRDDGFWVAIPDLRYPTHKIVIEYDGRHHEGSAQPWRWLGTPTSSARPE